jgi:hypothetical protein
MVIAGTLARMRDETDKKAWSENMKERFFFETKE